MFELCHHRENRALFVGEASGMSMSSCQVFSAPASSIAEPAPVAEGTGPAVPNVGCAGTDDAPQEPTKQLCGLSVGHSATYAPHA